MSTGSLSWEVKGVEAALKVLDALPEKVALKALTQTTRKWAIKIRDELRARAPVGDHPKIWNKQRSKARLPGNLRKKIKVTKAKEKLPHFYIRSTAYYARFLEFGTEKMTATEWMTKAWADINKEAIVESMADDIGKAIARELYVRKT